MCSSDDHGSEVAYFSFTVGNATKPPQLKEPKVWLDKNEFISGEKIEVHFTASDSYPENAYIAIVPSGVKHGSENDIDNHVLNYQHLRKFVWGTFIFDTPKEEGTYDVRMCSSDDNGREVAYTSFKVR